MYTYKYVNIYVSMAIRICTNDIVIWMAEMPKIDKQNTRKDIVAKKSD